MRWKGGRLMGRGREDRWIGIKGGGVAGGSKRQARG